MGIVSGLLGALGFGCKAGPQLRAGAPLPEFRAIAHDGSEIAPAGFRGRWLVLWFYPKADTPG